MPKSDINLALAKIKRRAESVDRSTLVDTFVDVGPLFSLLSSTDHQVIYGRRGTGKTHALLYVAESRAAKGDVTAYVDMRSVGSTGGLYADASIPLSERATRLLVDTLMNLHDAILDFGLSHMEDPDFSSLAPALDRLATAISDVEVVGGIEREEVQRSANGAKDVLSLGTHISTTGLSLQAGVNSEGQSSSSTETRLRRTGLERHRVHFGAVGSALERIAAALGNRHVWLILDEWSVVPADLQPYLADLLRRAVFPDKGITVKIGAIEQRSTFALASVAGDYIGIELGADASADLNLDDFMVFDNDARRAMDFFQELLYRHVKAALAEGGSNEVLSSPVELIQKGFTQMNVFEEYVRAVEGVPRDAVNIIVLAAVRSVDDPITMERVRRAAKEWYQRDKEKAVSSNPEALDLLHWIIDKVIAHRRARAFLLRSGTEDELVDSLFDSRVLHILKQNISAHDQPGIRYNVYKIDYGCYVDLLTTAKSPQGLLPFGDDAEDGGFIDVPPDDHRAIRRAILSLEEFYRSGKAGHA